MAVIDALKAANRASALDEDNERLFELALTTLRLLSTLNEEFE